MHVGVALAARATEGDGPSIARRTGGSIVLLTGVLAAVVAIKINVRVGAGA